MLLSRSEEGATAAAFADQVALCRRSDPDRSVGLGFELLIEREFSDADVARSLRENWLRVPTNTDLPAADLRFERGALLQEPSR